MSAPSALADLLATGGLHSVYQPIVDLESRETVAYEALLRGPKESPLHLPAAIFPAAEEHGLQDAVEWAGIKGAVEGALAAGMDTTISLFVNVEGASAGRARTAEQRTVMDRAFQQLRLVFEVTEHDLLANPGRLLLSVQQMRGRAYGLAIDDVGLNHPEGIAALTVVRPDVVKLDMSLVQGPSTAAQASVGLAVQAYTEASGGEVVAEGVENNEQLERAMVLGATLGQGYLFGRPGPLPQPLPQPQVAVPLSRRPARILSDTPYEIANERLRFRTATKRVLLPVSMQLEHRAEEVGPAVFLFSTFQDTNQFTAATAKRYARLSASCSLVAVFGAGMDPNPVADVRGGSLAPDDPLAGEWTVVVISPHYAAALVAKDLDEGLEDEMDRRFAFAVTHDRPLVAALGRSLMSRIADRA